MKRTASQRNSTRRANAEARGKGRVEAATELATVEARAAAVRLYLQGKTYKEIAALVDRSIPTVYSYLTQTRQELINKKQSFFDARLGLFFDDAFDSIASGNLLLADRDFLLDAAPERITAVADAMTALTDRVFYLAAITGRRQADTQAQLLPAPAGG